MILIILPIKNESLNILKTAGELFSWCENEFEENFKILFIDDWSDDDTVEKIKSIGKEKINVVNNIFDRGKGSALKAAYVYSTYYYHMNDDDLIAFMDGDGQISPREIRAFLNQMKLLDAEVVIGNKKHTYSITKYKMLRKIVSYFYNLMIRILFGIHYQDTQCGIKIFKKHALDEVIPKITTKKYAFDVELIIAMREMGFRVADAPVNIKKQINAGSVSFINIVKTFFDTLSVYVKMKKGFYSKEKLSWQK